MNSMLIIARREGESQMVRIVNGYIIEEADRDYEDRVFDEMEGM